ncbi:MAG: ABC transporter ATP-binding protein [Bdellovibrionales bacterium]
MSIVENLKVTKPKFQLEISRFEILDEGIHIIMGPSGCGKSTFIRTLLGLENSSSFKWTFGQEDIAKLAIHERRLGVVFQTWDLFPHMTATENVMFAAQARNLPKDETDGLWFQLKERLKMHDFSHTRADQLSGGEKQRTALARALIGKPRLLLLDEPFSSLDEKLKTEARDLVRDMIRFQKVPTLMVTHDLKEAHAMGDRISLFEDISKMSRN